MKHSFYGLIFWCLLPFQAHADSLARQVDGGAFDALYQLMAQYDGSAAPGQNHAAMNTFFGRQDLNASLGARIPSPQLDCPLPASHGDRSQSGADWLLKAAKSQRVLMLNENHYRIESRLFLWRLLPALKAHGYSFLGVETLNPDGPSSGETYGPEDGAYSGEPAFSALLRRAQTLGITLFAYEDVSAPPDSTQEEQIFYRETGQAQAIAKVLHHLSPNEKMLIFAGWSHIAEKSLSDGKGGFRNWMAAYLKQEGGIDPLTVDLTTCRFPSTDPKADMDGILVGNEHGTPLVHGQYAEAVDAQIALPVPSDEQSSPGYYRQLLGTPVKIPPEFLPDTTPVLIQAHRPDRLDLLADDRVLLYPGDDLPLYLTSGFEYVLTAQDGDGRILAKKTVTVGR